MVKLADVYTQMLIELTILFLVRAPGSFGVLALSRSLIQKRKEANLYSYLENI
jgi:hypothetical protein